MNISKSVLFFTILSLVGVLTYVGLQMSQSNFQSLKHGNTETRNQQILQEIINTGLDCDIQAPDGTVTSNNCILQTVVGNYAKGIMPQGYWIAAKKNNSWNIVVTGNGIPTCSEIDQHEIPKEIYGNCIEALGELRY